MIAVLADCTPDIERISIDVAFADVPGSERPFGAPATIAGQVRARAHRNCDMMLAMNRDLALQILRRAAPELRARYGVVSAQLFGSVARGEADDQSDIDVAVRFEGDGPVDVMALCGVSGLLSTLFDADVDVVALPTRDPALGAVVRREAAIAF